MTEPSRAFAGDPDSFGRLWTPHRMAYIAAGPQPLRDACPFCAAPNMSDEDSLIVARGTTAFVLLNLFPYNSGHLLVCPYRHISQYDEATAEEVAEIGALTQRGMTVLRKVSRCDGFNIGLDHPANFRRIVDEVVPILQERGVFRAAYDSTHLRGHLGLPVPENRHTAARRVG